MSKTSHSLIKKPWFSKAKRTAVPSDLSASDSESQDQASHTATKNLASLFVVSLSKADSGLKAVLDVLVNVEAAKLVSSPQVVV